MKYGVLLLELLFIEPVSLFHQTIYDNYNIYYY